MNSSPRVTVLLSTWQGERYLPELLSSLAAQTWPRLRIRVRDDGSTDGTVPLLHEFASGREAVEVVEGENLGVVGSFHELLGGGEGNAEDELYAFCDQDDVWLPDKIERAVRRILRTPDPASTLYCGRLIYTDAALREIGRSRVPSHLGFRNAVVENIAVGCTVVFGERIRRLLRRGRPGDMMMHDWWAYLAASAFGTVVYDEEPRILYRQHGENLAGWEGRARKIANRTRGLFRRLFAGVQGMDSLNQAVRFVETYGDLVPAEMRAVVERLLRLRGPGRLGERIRYILRPEVARNDPIENFGLKPMILFGWH